MLITVRGVQLLWRSFNRNFTFLFDVNYFLWRLKTSTCQGVKLLLGIKRKIFLFKTKLIPWAPVQNINKALKASRQQATSLEILVANTQFSFALATSWSQFRTLPIQNGCIGSRPHLTLTTQNCHLVKQFWFDVRALWGVVLPRRVTCLPQKWLFLQMVSLSLGTWAVKFQVDSLMYLLVTQQYCNQAIRSHFVSVTKGIYAL